MLGGKSWLCYNKTMKHSRAIIIISIIGLAALIMMLNLSSPTEIGPFGVLLFFTTLYVVIFGFVSLIMRLFYRFAMNREVFRNKDYLYAAVISFGPIMVLMARSFGAINFWTIGLILIFLFLTEFLVMKRA